LRRLKKWLMTCDSDLCISNQKWIKTKMKRPISLNKWYLILKLLEQMVKRPRAASFIVVW
jgi:hypothetical protein